MSFMWLLNKMRTECMRDKHLPLFCRLGIPQLPSEFSPVAWGMAAVMHQDGINSLPSSMSASWLTRAFGVCGPSWDFEVHSDVCECEIMLLILGVDLQAAGLPLLWVMMSLSSWNDKHALV
jgi:hypothetical protein